MNESAVQGEAAIKPLEAVIEASAAGVNDEPPTDETGGQAKGKRASKPRKAKGLTEFAFTTEIKVAACTRLIGIRHRIKRTKDGEAHPTQVAICEPDGNIRRLDLETEADELNWVYGVYVTKRRSLDAAEDVATLLVEFAKHCEAVHLPPPPTDKVPVKKKAGKRKKQDEPSLAEPAPSAEPPFRSLFLQLCKIRELKKKEDTPAVHPSQLLSENDKAVAVITDVPVVFDGLSAGDQHLTSLGGSGDRLSYALSRRSEYIQAQTGKRTGVFRLPPRLLKEQREKYARDKDTDTLTVVELFLTARNAFYECDVRDRRRIEVGERVSNRRDTQDDRKRCEQRLRQRVIGRAFICEGLYLEGSLEDSFRTTRANDAGLLALEAEEARCDKLVAEAIAQVDVYTEILAKVTGVGPITGAELFAAVGDIRRFQVHPDQGQLEHLRAESQRCFDEGYLLADALDVLVTPEHVRREKSWVDLTALLRFVAGLRLARGDMSGASELNGAVAILDVSADDVVSIDGDNIVITVKEMCRHGHLADELFAVRDRQVMDRFLFIGAVAAHKRASGKIEEADKLGQGLDFMRQTGKLKWKARERSKAKLRHHTGTHVRQGGKYADVPPEKAFPRTRRGETCNWNRMGRQRLFLLVADQFNKRPGTEWGERLRAIKARLHVTHPEPVKNDAGKSRWTDGHIHKTAIWRCTSKFVNWLYDQWMRLELEHQRQAATRAKA